MGRVQRGRDLPPRSPRLLHPSKALQPMKLPSCGQSAPTSRTQRRDSPHLGSPGWPRRWTRLDRAPQGRRVSRVRALPMLGTAEGKQARTNRHTCPWRPRPNDGPSGKQGAGHCPQHETHPQEPEKDHAVSWLHPGCAGRRPEGRRDVPLVGVDCSVDTHSAELAESDAPGRTQSCLAPEAADLV
jgi:hypothetical protein